MNPETLNPKQGQHDVDLGQEPFKDTPAQPERIITVFDDADILVFKMKQGDKQ